MRELQLHSNSLRWLLVAGLIAAAGCFGDPEPPAATEAVAPPPVAARPPDAPSEAQSEVRSTDPAASKVRLPDDGLVIRELDDGLLLFAKGVHRFEVLQALAVRYRFEVVDWDEEDPVVDLHVEAAALETALARLIEPSSYTLQYHEDRKEGRNRIALLEVGTPPPPNELGADDPKDEKDEKGRAKGERGARVARTYALRTQAEHDAAMERRQLRIARRHQEALEELESEDPEVREDAVSGLDATDEADRARLMDVALNDPDPDVRAEAVKQMSFGDGTVELVKALEDPDNGVLIEALKAISWLEDPGLADAVVPLLDHPNEDVAAQAKKTIGYLGHPRN